MSQSIPDFWQLVIESRLLSAEQIQQLQTEFDVAHDNIDQGNSAALAKWLTAKKTITPYQSAILQAGRAGPFIYGEYKVLDLLKQEPLSGAFRAVHTPTNHPVLLRFAAPRAGQDANWWTRLSALAQRHCAVEHPNLSRCFQVVDLESFRFLASELLAGQPLSARLPVGKKVKIHDACRVVRRVALAIDALHQAGLVHGDIRPEFVWVGSGGSVTVAREPFHQPELLHGGNLPESWSSRADYLAPELAQPGRSPDHLSDIYALGCFLYRILAGQPPFPGGDLTQKIQRHATEPIQSLNSLGVPEALNQIVSFMMAKNSEVRFQEANAVAEQLAQFVRPDQLEAQPAVALPTLLAYENWMKQNPGAAVPTPPVPTPAAPIPAGTPPRVAHPPQSAPAFQYDAVQEQQSPDPAPQASTAVASHEVVPEINTTGQPGPSSPAVPVVSTGSAGTSISQQFRRRRRGRKNLLFAVSSLLGAAVFGIALFMVLSEYESLTSSQENGPDNTSDPAPDNQQPLPDEPEQNSNVNAEDTRIRYVEVADDGTSLWSSPTSGSPVSFSYVPRSVRLLIVTRPASLVASGEGELVLQALGPRFETLRNLWEKSAGISFSQIDQMIVGLHDNPDGIPHTSFVVRLADHISEPGLVRGWGSPRRRFVPDRSAAIFVNESGWSFFIPRGESEEPGTPVHHFLMGTDSELVMEVAQRGPAPPTMIRSMKGLSESTDDQRHATIIFSRTHIFNDEFQGLYGPSMQRLIKPLRSILWRDNLKAAMLSMHFGQQQSYIEARLQSDTVKGALDLSKDVEQLVETIPNQVDEYVRTLDPHPYWKDVWFRYPQQIWALHDQMRIAREDSQVVLNAWLPGPATHNLIAGTELVMSTRPGQSAGPRSPDTTSGPKTIEQLLASPFNLQIESDDMIRVMEVIQSGIQSTYRRLPFRFKIEILGTDLQLEGITQNQRVNDFKMEGTLADILTGVVMKANPVTTVTDPSQKDQKLIWVVAADPDSGQKMVFITTRSAAEKKQFQLPAPFQPR